MQPEPQPAGRVADVRRYPLKSAGGESADELAVGAGGLDGDRAWLLVGRDGSPVTARAAPALRQVSARAAAGDEPPLLDVAGRPSLQGEAAEQALSELAGRAVHLVPAAHQVEVAAVHLVSAGAHADPGAPPGCDPEPRANLVLDLPEPGAERGWAGRRLRLGDGPDAVQLRVTRTPARCLGVYAEVERGGRVRVGDPVTLLPR